MHNIPRKDKDKDYFSLIFQPVSQSVYQFSLSSSGHGHADVPLRRKLPGRGERRGVLVGAGKSALQFVNQSVNPFFVSSSGHGDRNVSLRHELLGRGERRGLVISAGKTDFQYVKPVR